MLFLQPKKTLLILAMLTVLGVLAGCARPNVQPPYQLNAAQVERLFLNHTVISRNLNTDTVSVSYYGPDGTVRQIRNDRYRGGFWRVKQNGAICMQMQSNKESCRFIRRDKDKIYRKYRPSDSGLQPIIAYDAPNAFVHGDKLKDVE